MTAFATQTARLGSVDSAGYGAGETALNPKANSTPSGHCQTGSNPGEGIQTVTVGVLGDWIPRSCLGKGSDIPGLTRTGKNTRGRRNQDALLHCSAYDKQTQPPWNRAPARTMIGLALEVLRTLIVASLSMPALAAGAVDVVMVLVARRPWDLSKRD